MCKTTTQKIIKTSLGDSENLNKWRGNSLEVQWLKQAFTAVDLVLIPGQGTKIP